MGEGVSLSVMPAPSISMQSGSSAFISDIFSLSKAVSPVTVYMILSSTLFLTEKFTMRTDTAAKAAMITATAAMVFKIFFFAVISLSLSILL